MAGTTLPSFGTRRHNCHTCGPWYNSFRDEESGDGDQEKINFIEEPFVNGAA